MWNLSPNVHTNTTIKELNKITPVLSFCKQKKRYEEYTTKWYADWLVNVEVRAYDLSVRFSRIWIRFIFSKAPVITNDEKANLIRNWRNCAPAQRDSHWPQYTFGFRWPSLLCFLYALLVAFVFFGDGFVIEDHFWSQKIRSNSTSKVISRPCDDDNDDNDGNDNDDSKTLYWAIIQGIDKDITVLVLDTRRLHIVWMTMIRLEIFSTITFA